MKRKHLRSKPRKPSVSVIRESGGKRKGRSMKRNPSEVRTGYVTREQLVNAPQGSDVLVDSRGKVRMIVYRREA